MEIHPILEAWLNDWVWPTPFTGPGVDFRMRLTRERLVPVWNRIVLRALEGAPATEAKDNRGEYPNAFCGESRGRAPTCLKQKSTQLLAVSHSRPEKNPDPAPG